jgi:type II secretory pathway component GspD/PulD (secretin)
VEDELDQAPSLPGNRLPGSRRAPAATPPIRIARRPDGGLIISSADPAALDALEELMHLFAPREKDYATFMLEDFFEAQEERKSSFEYSPYFGVYPSSRPASGPRRLSRRPPITFISDYYTNTIIVQGADNEQLATIRELIELYDQPESEESRTVRMQKIFQIQHSKAQVVADAIKDVYRDLLSENDPARQNPNQNKEQAPAERSYTYIYGNPQGEGEEREPPIKFKGLLSLGVDPVSNTIIVSAQETLLESVGQMIESLDRAAAPTSTVRVVQIDGGFNPELLQKQLNGVFGKKPAPGSQPGQPVQPGQPGQQPGQPGQQQPGQPNAAQAVQTGG